ncbi:MAG: hypothetical protein JXB49_25920 [Bacteroidales bacterium]|nr:hypothetical protein [Bacteroidales bacterium]
MKSLLLFIACTCFFFCSCKKIKEYTREPDLNSLRYGLKSSAAIGYCASVAMAAFNDQPLPSNMYFQAGRDDEYSKSGLVFINVDDAHPIPFNHEVGQIIIGGLWDTDNSGVISIVLLDMDLLKPDFSFYGIYTIPVIFDEEKNTLLTVFARQDIIIGEGSDTILSFSMSNPQIQLEKERAEESQPTDVFAAVKQNVWFVNIDQNNTMADFYDDTYWMNGGGQIVEASSSSAGIIYHAMIEAKYNHSICDDNPYKGVSFIQNLRVGDLVDIGTILMNFHDQCNGNVEVEAATGRYFKSSGKELDLGL